MQRQVQELTFQLSIVSGAKRSIKTRLTRANKLEKEGPFPVLLSICSAQQSAQLALGMIEQAVSILKEALDIAERSNAGETVDVSEPEVAAMGVAAVQLMDSAKWMDQKADYHLKRVKHLSS